MFCVATTLVLASVLTVDDDGPADFDDLPAAVAAAAPGDTILVAPGSYSPFDAAKPLSIVGAGPHLVRVRADAVGSTLSSIPAGSELVLSGMSFQGDLTPGLVPLEVCASEGTVVLHDLLVGATPTSTLVTPPGGILVRSAAQVLLLGSELRGGGYPTPSTECRATWDSTRATPVSGSPTA